MKTIIAFLIALALSGTAAFSQSTLDPGPYLKHTATERQVTPYSFLREADVIWSKRVWRVIDLQEKINLPLKYPSTKQTNDRKSLIDVVMDAIEVGALTAYSFEDDEFTRPLLLKEIESRGGARTDTITMQEPEPPYNEYQKAVSTEFSRDKVVGFRVKEDWFFDKQRSVMEVRVIGIAPLIYAVDEKGEVREGNIRIPLFWIYYPEARKLFASTEVFNNGNNAQRLTYDDIFQKRLFGSYIYKESNVYDRRIEDYKQGLSALLESERIKEDITNFEHDMWEF